jgi:two-component system sensor histidine kinase RegB
MDRPLLALTSRGAAPRKVPPTDAIATENMRQLIQLRWTAVGGQLLTILIVTFGLHVPLPLAPMLTVIGLLILANLVGTALLRRRPANNVQIMLALLFDMGALTAQLYLSGGAANPFISLYLLQVVLGAILLELWSAWVLVAVASLCYAGLTRGSRPLDYPARLAPDIADLNILGGWISFLLIGTLLALFITRITRNLRTRDQYLADLRQHAAEEEGIVRMGLFASGAAHELGTPLASLSVILGDWRRMPRLTGDPELAGELGEMQAEVERCKAIVTGILHSAGEPRGEAMESTDACAFLDDAIVAWQPTHADVPLDYRCEGLEGAAVVTGVSLRQAIWNLLDNAAEVSPSGISLTATRGPEELVIAVADRGPGFPEAQLATVGRLYQSSKGAGHGLGLFLATNVARRLGGRIEAANRPAGGAEVRLLLPLAPARPRTI